MRIDYATPGALRVECSEEEPGEGPVFGVTGGRTFTDREFVWEELDVHYCTHRFAELVFGCATGVDALALEWASYHMIPWRRYVADWDRFSTKAGGLRNGAMLADADVQLLLVFPGGVGTTDCARKARRWGIERVFLSPVTDPLEEYTRWG